MGDNITKEKVLEALSQVYDPEIPIDIVNLGLVYDVDISKDVVNLKMTMTSPGCPSAHPCRHRCSGSPTPGKLRSGRRGGHNFLRRNWGL